MNPKRLNWKIYPREKKFSSFSLFNCFSFFLLSAAAWINMQAGVLVTWLGVVANLFVLLAARGSILECPRELPCDCSLTVDRMTMDFLLVVDCASRGFTKFPKLVFNEGSKIQLIDLRNNSFQFMPSDAFPALNVESIDFSVSENVTIHKDALKPLRHHLHKAVLTKMGITFHERLDYLKDLVHIRELVLDYNGGWPLQFPGGFFRGMNLLSLKKLSLRSCGIFRLSWGAFVGLEHLKELDLSGNFLPDIPVEVSRLTQLRKLVLNSNQIRSLQENTFQHLKHLQELHLVSNQLVSVTSIHEDAFNGLVNSLQLLDLSNNGLTAVPIHALSNLEALHTLLLSNNRIPHLVNGSFDGNFKLKQLHISGNPMHFEEFMFSGLEESLRRLYLKNMKLPSLPNQALKELQKLVFIDVSHNNFQHIKKHFFEGVRARRLVMRSMKVRHISPAAFVDLHRPIAMDLSDNRIHDVSFVVQALRCTFYELNLTMNPIECDCNVERIVNSGTVEHLLGKCTTPKQYENTDLKNKTLGLALKRLCGSSERIFCDWHAETSHSAGHTHTTAITTTCLISALSLIASIRSTLSLW